MNVKRLHLDRKLLLKGLESHFPPGCWGYCDSQFVYIQAPHDLHPPVDEWLWIKGRWWKIVSAEFLAHVATERVELRALSREFG